MFNLELFEQNKKVLPIDRLLKRDDTHIHDAQRAF